MPLWILVLTTRVPRNLDRMSQLFNKNPIIYEMALQDLTADVKNPETGAEGMTGKQAVRAAIIKEMEGFSYEELSFHSLGRPAWFLAP
jgi:hypothetical protein